MNKTEQKHIARAEKLCNSRNLIDPHSGLTDIVMVDASAGPNHFHYMVGNIPCITKARGMSQGFYILNINRYTTWMELAKLQGWDPDRLLSTSASGRRLGAALGNGMTKTVLKSVLRKAIWSAGLVSKKPC